MYAADHESGNFLFLLFLILHTKRYYHQLARGIVGYCLKSVSILVFVFYTTGGGDIRNWLGYLIYFSIIFAIAKCTMTIAPNANIPG